MTQKKAGNALPEPKTAVSYVPSAVYRLQFNSHFTFRHAAELVPYLHELGIDCVYSSPYFQAIPGSEHGYNITDPNKINPEVGGAEEYGRFCEVLNRNEMGQILDIVPNHMGIWGNQNLWWQDVLENGPASIYASFFDIEWDSVKAEIKDKVLIPILGNYYGDVLENQEIKITYADGRFWVEYFSHKFPLAPETYHVILESDLEILGIRLGKNAAEYLEYQSIIRAFSNLPLRTERQAELKTVRDREKEIAKKRLAALTEQSAVVQGFIEDQLQIFNGRKGDPRSFDRLDQLLAAQGYRLAFWRVASEEINYRRFFDINELAAIRMEDPEVFKRCHEMVFRLLQSGRVQGLRIDHPDGLYDPAEYFRRLQEHYRHVMNPGAISSSEEKEGEAGEPSLFIVAEKILERKESLPEDWEICGTVGYEFLNSLNGVFIKKENQGALDEIYEKFIGRSIDFGQLLYEKKKLFSLLYMASEINALGHLLDVISEHQRRYRDFTRNNLTLAIREVIACFPVYRTYLSQKSQMISERDQKYIAIAVEKAKSRTPYLNPAVYDFLKRVMLLQWDIAMEKQDIERYQDFVLRFQQLSGPVMAKGLEDTAFYIYNRLISQNEVGADPSYFGVSPEDFHSQNIERNKRWPYSFLASSTHDTKRSEDVRQRINVLSELPSEWKTGLERWTMLNAKHKTLIREVHEPDANFEYFIYQTLAGIWPDEPGIDEGFIQRMSDYFLKSARESKVRTNWTTPDAEYEEALKKFIAQILNPEEANRFIPDFSVFQKKVSALGLWNSLSALILKMGSPGVVDTYQGCELWNYTLVDPDNRRPVDFESRVELLRELKKQYSVPGDREPLLNQLLEQRTNGQLKLYATWKALNFRKQHPDLFLGADYKPLKAEGKWKGNVIAFARENGGKIQITAAGRFFSELLASGAHEDGIPAGEIWEDTKIAVPSSWGKDLVLTDIFTGHKISPQEFEGNLYLSAADLFAVMSAALYTNIEVRV